EKISEFGKIIPYLTIDTASDIASLERLIDTSVTNTVIISNLYAQTKKGSVIGNIFNPLLADLRREMQRLGYKDNNFLGFMLEEKRDFRIWNDGAPERFTAARIALEYLKTKHPQILEFEKFKQSSFMQKAEKSIDYAAALILSRKGDITQEEFEDIKAENQSVWLNALETVKYMEFIVFKQLKEDVKKIKNAGISVIVETNLMTLADSVDFKEGYFEIGNDGERALLPQYNGISESFSFEERLEFLRDELSVSGFLITNIEVYHNKESVCAHLRKALQNGLNNKTALIFEDEESAKYPDGENVYLLSPQICEDKNAIFKSGLDVLSSPESVLETLKNEGLRRISVAMSFAVDAPMKLETIRANANAIASCEDISPAQYYARGYEDAVSNDALFAQAQKIIISDEESAIYKIRAKGVLIFAALYSYIKTNSKNGAQFQSYLSESGGLFETARKYLSVLGENSPVMRYVEKLELKSKSASEDRKNLYNMQLMGFVNALIEYKYGFKKSPLKAKIAALADSFYVKDNFLNYVPNDDEIKSLYGLYLGVRDKKRFALKLYEYLKNWNKIYDGGKNAKSILWLAEQVSLFIADLPPVERDGFAARVSVYLNDMIQACQNISRNSIEEEALYLNALSVCASVNKMAADKSQSSYFETEMQKEAWRLNKKYFDVYEKFSTDMILLFSLSGLKEVFGSEDMEKVLKDFKKYSLTDFGGLKRGKAYPYYLYYYSMFVPYGQIKKSLETADFYIEENLCLPEFFSRKNGFSAGGNFRDRVSAAYAAMLFDAVDDDIPELKIEEQDYKKITECARAILFAA
ncbi:MAG: hypothetical protein LBU09_01535, partial [Endomicrobium sp.]|nr:hypothetical protein [Endomicrobium sp.]